MSKTKQYFNINRTGIDPQNRQWHIVINNPAEHGYTLDKIKDILHSKRNIVYFCISFEIGLDGNTIHAHIYFRCSSSMRKSTVKRKFPSTHVEECKGTPQQNREYILKIGKWENDVKARTKIEDTWYEWGECPVQKQGKRTDIEHIYQMIRDGKTIAEILNLYPHYIRCIHALEKAINLIRAEIFNLIDRHMEVGYIYGDSYHAMENLVLNKYGHDNVYIVRDYNNPFDRYTDQEVIVFSRFEESLPIYDMITYASGVPVALPSRGFDKVACFNKVYILSHKDLSSQYNDIQKDYPHEWDTFLNFIHGVIEYDEGNLKVSPMEEYRANRLL